MHGLRLVYFLPIALLAMTRLQSAEFDLAATATNQLAVDLHRQFATGDENLCLSSYSIESALAMTFGNGTRASLPHRNPGAVSAGALAAARSGNNAP
jgi:hypothetical protein